MIDKPETLIAILTNVATLLAFVVFIVPGFVSLRTYELLRGGAGRKINEAIVDVVVYSLVTDVVALPLLLLTALIPNVVVRIIASAVAALASLVGLPILLGRSWFRLQQHLSRSGIIGHPSYKPWDEIFTRIVREKREVGVILTLPDGRKFGGKYVDPGFASEYPADEQLLLGESWSIDQETGRFVERAAGELRPAYRQKGRPDRRFVEWSARWSST